MASERLNKFKAAFFKGSKIVGRGAASGLKAGGRFAVKKAGETIQSQIKLQKQKREIVKQERLKAFRRSTRSRFGTAPRVSRRKERRKVRRTNGRTIVVIQQQPQQQVIQKQIQQKQIQQKQIQKKTVQSFSNLLGLNNNKPIKFF